MKIALVEGAGGQTGSYLCELLLDLGYKVVGGVRRSSTNNLKNLEISMKNPNFSKELMDVTDYFSVFNICQKHKPDEIYNFCSQSHVGTSFDQPSYTMDTIIKGALHNLEYIKNHAITTKLFLPSSSEMWGTVTNKNIPQNEYTPMLPNSAYGVAKLAAHNLARVYRNSYGMKVNCGIMTNHESPRRSDDFVTKKIVNYVKAGEFSKPLQLGNIDIFRDWQHAKDVARACYLIMQQPTGDDFVISSGETRSLREFIDDVIYLSDTPFKYESVPAFIRPLDVPFLWGDSSKARSILGWKPNISYAQLVSDMLFGDFDHVKQL